jgi:hypothetical protein
MPGSGIHDVRLRRDVPSSASPLRMVLASPRAVTVCDRRPVSFTVTLRLWPPPEAVLAPPWAPWCRSTACSACGPAILKSMYFWSSAFRSCSGTFGSCFLASATRLVTTVVMGFS